MAGLAGKSGLFAGSGIVMAVYAGDVVFADVAGMVEYDAAARILHQNSGGHRLRSLRKKIASQRNGHQRAEKYVRRFFQGGLLWMIRYWL